jgi:hypothetical protein
MVDRKQNAANGAGYPLASSSTRRLVQAEGELALPGGDRLPRHRAATGNFSEHITHYTVPRTLESAYGLACVANSCSTSPITDVWI